MLKKRRKLAGDIFGGAAKSDSKVSCTKFGCGSGAICDNGRCAIPAGKSCKPAVDRCQGGYYCSKSRICNGSGLSKLNVKCTSTTECDKGLYCDLKQKKCLEVKGESICTKNSDCSNCTTGDCVCSGGSYTSRSSLHG